MILAALLLLAALLSYQIHQGRLLMATVEELVAKIQAFKDAVVPQIDAAVVDIQKIHDLLDANTGGGVDLDGAIAALDEVLGKFVALKEQVDRPEGGS